MSWTAVFTSLQPHEIEIVKNILDDNGIKYVVIDKRDSMYGSVVSPGIEVHIQNDDFIKGKKLISEFESQ